MCDNGMAIPFSNFFNCQPYYYIKVIKEFKRPIYKTFFQQTKCGQSLNNKTFVSRKLVCAYPNNC